MADPRFVGSAIRRRMGAPSSHLGMVQDAAAPSVNAAGATAPESTPALPSAPSPASDPVGSNPVSTGNPAYNMRRSAGY